MIAKLVFVVVVQLLGHAVTAQTDFADKNEILTAIANKGDSYVAPYTEEIHNSHFAKNKRDYGAVIMLTVLDPARGCQICKMFYDGFQSVAYSWNAKFSGSNKLYFYLADYDVNPKAFEVYKIDGAPFILYIPPKQNKKVKINKMQLTSDDDLTADGISSWLYENTKIRIKIVKPLPWKLIICTALVSLFVLSILYLVRDKITLKMASVRNFVACVILLMVYYCLGGAMWNKINRSPFSNPGETGLKSYIGTGSREQLFAETYIMMVIYSMITIGFIIMTEVPQMKSRKFVKIGVMLLGLGIFVGFFQLIISTAVLKESYLPHSSILWWL